MSNLVIACKFAKVFHPNIINALKGNGALTKFTKVFPSKCIGRVICPCHNFVLYGSYYHT